jgi:putative ABC transport system permease protein
MRLSPNFTRYTQNQQLLTLSENVLRRVRSVSGVESAAFATNYPFNPGGLVNGPNTTNFEIEGRPTSKGELAPLADVNIVSADYFQTVGIPVLEGRALTDRDDQKATEVAVINQTMARHRFLSEDPVGKRFSVDQRQTWVKIVGVVGDVKEYGLDRPVGDEIYATIQQGGFAGRLVVRTAADPMSVSAALRAALHEVDAQLAVDQMQTVENLQHESVASPRVTTILLGLFAALALVICASGIAAVMALSVTQRTNELGIRLALGASRESILFMVLRQGLMLASIGAVIGILGALALTRLLSSLLYETSATDMSTFAVVALLFLVVAAVACFIPARQVTGIDPLVALRQE